MPAPMSAVVMEQTGGPRVLRLKRIERPVPAPRELLVRVGAVSVSPLDLQLRAGTRRLGKSLPHILGGEAAGTVHEVGAGVDGIRPDDRVLVCSDSLGTDRQGTYADYVLARVEELHPLPDEVGFVTAAAVGRSFATAWRALVDVGRLGRAPSFEKRERVVVSDAASGVGSAAVQIARRLGATVVAISDGGGAARLMMLGAQRVVSHSAENLNERVVTAFDGRLASLILDIRNTVHPEQSVHMLEPHGRIVLVGSTSDAWAGVDRSFLARRDITVRESSNTLDPEEMAEILRLVADGTFHPVIDAILPLSAAAHAHRRISRSFGMIVLVPDDLYRSKELRKPDEEARSGKSLIDP